MNPRLAQEWLRYLVTVGGARGRRRLALEDRPDDALGGFGPWRPEWSMLRLPGLARAGARGARPEQPEVMGWGTSPEDVVPYLPPGARFEALEDVGHFVHIEQPRAGRRPGPGVPGVTGA